MVAKQILNCSIKAIPRFYIYTMIFPYKSRLSHFLLGKGGSFVSHSDSVFQACCYRCPWATSWRCLLFWLAVSYCFMGLWFAVFSEKYESSWTSSIMGDQTLCSLTNTAQPNLSLTSPSPKSTRIIIRIRLTRNRQWWDCDGNCPVPFWLGLKYLLNKV